MTVIILPQSRQNGQTNGCCLPGRGNGVFYSLSVLFCTFLILCSHISPITFAKPLNMKYICVYVKDGRVCVPILMQVLVWVCVCKCSLITCGS